VQFSLKALLAFTVVAALVMGAWSNQPFEVNSSSIDSVLYNGWAKTLDVEFKNGSVYRYYKVPRKTYREFMNAESHGSYFHHNIRKGDFEYELIEK
jgi:hypothetical protein